jgi:hypothetical protein
MNATTKMMWALAGFFVLVDVVYIVWNLQFEAQHLATTPTGGERGPIEWVGTVALVLSAVLAVLIAFYLGRSHKSQGGELPADRLDASIDDDDPEQGFFSPYSWWPLTLSASLALVFAGIAVGFWIAAIGLVGTVISIVGFAFEYYRGFFSR